MVLIFGLYHVKYHQVQSYLALAKSLGITHFDTAQMYGNERICAESCNASDYITTKIYVANTAGQIDKMVKRSIHRFGTKQINCMLLHRPMPNECWTALTHHNFGCIGVSNYDQHTLQGLLAFCEENNIKKPDVHQMEVHPFIDCLPLIQYCNNNGIRVQGHTVLTQGKFLAYPPLVELAAKYNVSPASILIAWTASKNIDICVSSGSEFHLTELIAGSNLVLAESDISEMDNWHTQTSHRFYTKSIETPYTLDSQSSKEYIARTVDQLKKDIASDYPSDTCDNLPLGGEPYRIVGRVIAEQLYPDKPEASLPKYRALIKLLRTKRINSRKAEINYKKGHTCCVVPRTNIRALNETYSDHIMFPKPMPVNITDPEEFNPLFEYLSSNSSPQIDTVFIRGAIFPDGRMDLCKQVVGPTSIKQLCKTVARSTIVRHFLLGNNVVLQEHEEEGADAFAMLMRNNDIPIETWYLAGNCIGPVAIEIMAKALSTNTQCKALWLKRNPVGPLGATYLNSMLKVNTNLVLLDLHNCALGDEGINNLLANPEELKALKHLYLDANAIESTTAIAKWAAITHPVTLYLSINRLGDEAITELCLALHDNPRLKRLCLSSTQMNNKGLIAVVDMALTCPKLKCINVGCYKSSADMGEYPGNLFDDDVLPDLVRLITQSKSLEYLNTASCKISKEGLLSLPRTDTVSMDLGVGSWHHVHEKNKLRFVKQPKRIVHIDSIYRGKM